MKTYEIIILGSGFTSLGILSKTKNALVIEKSECLDCSFYLPLKSYAYKQFIPSLPGATQLYKIFNELNLFSSEKQNVNGFDVALCSYASEIGANILLRSDVLSVESHNTQHIVTVYNNGGIKSYKAKRVIDTRSEKLNPVYTVLFSGEETETKKIERIFNGKVESAFHKGWYALRFDASGFDVNDVTVYVYERWVKSSIASKILYMPPRFLYTSNNPLCDDYYSNPIKAFEFGESFI